MWSLSSYAVPSSFPSYHKEGSLWGESKPCNKLQKCNLVRQMPKWMSQNSHASWYNSSSKAGHVGYRFLLSIGLVAGGAFTAFRYVSQVKERKNEGIAVPSEARGLVASCLEGGGKIEKDDNVFEMSSRKFKGAIERSRDILQRAKDEIGAPGIVAAVSVDGKLVWSEGIGYADVENRIPCQPNSVFRIASISKSLAMTAVARLMEEGKLDLDKPVQEYVPSFPEKEWEGEKVSITTRHLVSHLGGIRHYDKAYMKKKTEEKSSQDTQEGNVHNKSTGKAFEKKQKTDDTNKAKDKENTQNSTSVKTQDNFDEMKSKKEFKTVNSALDLFKDDPLMHKPGSKYLYTTHGFTLVSAVVEGASGKDFVSYMRTMLRDMGLTETVPDRHIPIIYNRARGYRYKNGKLENCPYVDLSYKWAGGGYLSTVEDLVKFGNIMLYSYQQPANHADQTLPGFLKKDTMETIWNPVPIAKSKPTNEYCYAMGWFVSEKEQEHGECRPKRHFVSHSGGAMGFSSMLIIAPTNICREGTSSNSGGEKKDGSEKNNGTKSIGASHIPKGVVVALFVNLIDVGLTKQAEGIVEAFEQCAGTN